MIPTFRFGFHVFLSILLIAQIVFLFIRIVIDSCEQNANFQQQQLDHDHHKGRSTGVFKIRAERLPNGFNLSSIFQKSSSLGIPIHYPPQSNDYILVPFPGGIIIFLVLNLNHIGSRLLFKELPQGRDSFFLRSLRLVHLHYPACTYG
jgi:hypothetical protein